MRSIVFTLALIAAPLAAAQTPAPAPASTPEHQLALAAHQLAAMWRPVPPGRLTAASLTAACDGALTEMTALDARLPIPMTVDNLADIRAEHGLVFVPTDENPSVMFVFPNDDELRGIASGLANFTLDPAGEGKLVLTDAAGHDSNLELGHAGGHALLRIRPRGSADVQLYVSCASAL